VCDNCHLKTSYIWTRVGSLTGFQSLQKIVSPGLSAQSDPSSSPCESYRKTQRYFTRKGVAVAWRVVNIVDLCLFYNLKLRYALLRGHVVICDRYVPDMFADLYVYTSGQGNRLVLKFLSWCLPKPKVNIFLEVAPEVALQRSGYKECSEYLERQRELYREVQNVPNIMHVNAHCELNTTSDAVIREILKEYFEDYENLYLY
jgi:hypothetical protein